MTPQTYLNPVYDRPCPDPFVLKHCGIYWAYCTDRWSDGRVFGVLRSTDLVHWDEVSGALEPLEGDHPMYWAPEVSYFNGLFYLYYSVGNETLMQIRVAVAEHPAGPFVDQGRRLTGEDFAIDAHVFADDDGARYLFYATDFLSHSHIGTGTVCDRLIDPLTLAGDPRPVTRPRYDWQVYDPRRQDKGGVRWHTVEGSFTLKHKGRYYQMFSGGNWQNVSYGVSYAVTDDLRSREEWRQAADGERVFPILRTVPGAVIGPGHNSVVRGPDNQQLFCVYHRWRADGSGRAMAIDRLDWAGERMLILGPSTDPQPAPNHPARSGFAAGWRWERGRWQADAHEARCEETSQARASLSLPGPHVVVEISLNVEIDSDLQGWSGLAVEAADGATLLRWRLDADLRSITIEWADADSMVQLNAALPQPLRRGAFHLLRLELNGGTAGLTLNDQMHVWHGDLAAQPATLALESRDLAAAWAGFSLTEGWQDTFGDDQISPEQLGWRAVRGQASLAISAQELRCQSGGDQPAILAKDAAYAAYEAVANLRLLAPPAGSGYGFCLWAGAGPALTLILARAGAGWSLRSSADQAEYALPDSFDPLRTQQFRLRLAAGQLSLYCETRL
ncbi:MAG TPA: glycoside hydrolase family 43 protein, partial [Herpetosiphonaceae bacterium]|nr:glycoside hydrolase family 43 protein [Herpetosiphonaceae bacterium]